MVLKEGESIIHTSIRLEIKKALFRQKQVCRSSRPPKANREECDSPEGVHVGCGGKGEAVLVVTWAHPAHNLWCEITNPAMWKF